MRNVQYVSKRIAGDLLPIQEQNILADAVISVVPTMHNDSQKESLQELSENHVTDEQTKNYSETLSDDTLSDEVLSVSELELQQTIESIGAMIQEMVASGSLEQLSDDDSDETETDEHQAGNDDSDNMQSTDNGGLQLIETNKQTLSDSYFANENVATVSKRRSDILVTDTDKEEKNIELQQVETKSE